MNSTYRVTSLLFVFFSAFSALAGEIEASWIVRALNEEEVSLDSFYQASRSKQRPWKETYREIVLPKTIKLNAEKERAFDSILSRYDIGRGTSVATLQPTMPAANTSGSINRGVAPQQGGMQPPAPISGRDIPATLEFDRGKETRGKDAIQVHDPSKTPHEISY